MTILLRDAIAGMAGMAVVVGSADEVFESRMEASWFIRSFRYSQRNAVTPDSVSNVTHLHLQRESITIEIHPSAI